MAALTSSFVGSTRDLGFKAAVGSTDRLQQQQVRAPRLERGQPLIEDRVVIRFARFGRKYSPFYRIVAVDSRVRRDGRPIEYLGWYNPLNKETNLNAPKIKEWIGTGAIPSDTVRNLLKKAMVIED